MIYVIVRMMCNDDLQCCLTATAVVYSSDGVLDDILTGTRVSALLGPKRIGSKHFIIVTEQAVNVL